VSTEHLSPSENAALAVALDSVVSTFCSLCGRPSSEPVCPPCLHGREGTPFAVDPGYHLTEPATRDMHEPFRLEVLTARALAALPDPPEADLLLGPLVRRGARTVIVGDTGHGKTALVAQLVRAILAGEDVLGYSGAAVGPGLIVDLEQGLRTIKRILAETRLDQRDDLLYVACPDGLALGLDPKASDPDHLAELDRIIADHKPAVVSLDPFYKAHRGDANEERGVVDLMRVLDALRARHGFALILPAHPRKDATSNGVRKLTLHDVAGSGAIVRGAELVLAIERLSHGYARLRILKDRDGDLPVGEAWPLIFTRAEGFKLDPKEERSAEELEQRILSDEGGWRTVKEWAGELSIREKRTKDLLEQLVESGHVESAVGPPGRSSRAHCYRTAPEPWAKSGAVTPSLLDAGTAPTAPTSIGDVGVGAVSGTAPEPGAVGAEEQGS
jgi:AAA domain